MGVRAKAMKRDGCRSGDIGAELAVRGRHRKEQCGGRSVYLLVRACVLICWPAAQSRGLHGNGYGSGTLG